MKLKNVEVGMKVLVKTYMVDTYYSVPDSLKGTVQQVLGIDSSGHNQSVRVSYGSGNGSGSYWLNHKNVKKVTE